MFARLRADAKGLIKEAVQLCWYMRGSIQYRDILDMIPMERDIIKEHIKEHMENIKGHQFPIY
jgi:hypothetical protein